MTAVKNEIPAATMYPTRCVSKASDAQIDPDTRVNDAVTKDKTTAPGRRGRDIIRSNPPAGAGQGGMPSLALSDSCACSGIREA